MSDLTATNCSSCSSTFGGGCNSIIWILILLSLCGNNNNNGCGFGLFGRSGCDGDCGSNFNNNNGCEWILWIILLSCLFNNNNNGCGC